MDGRFGHGLVIRFVGGYNGGPPFFCFMARGGSPPGARGAPGSLSSPLREQARELGELGRPLGKARLSLKSGRVACFGTPGGGPVLESPTGATSPPAQSRLPPCSEVLFFCCGHPTSKLTPVLVVARAPACLRQTPGQCLSHCEGGHALGKQVGSCRPSLARCWATAVFATL